MRGILKSVQTGLPILDSLTVNPLYMVFFLVAVVIGLTVHEFAHAFVASRQGDQTARYAGRISLNPLAHLDALGSLMFLFAGIGYAKPVPVNPANLKDGRLGDFYVSIAGIVTNILTAFVFSLPFQLILLTGGDITAVNTDQNLGLLFCKVMFEVNILLAAFNLLPIPPLDGSKAIGIFVPRRYEMAYQRYLQVGVVALLGLLMVSFILKINLLGPLIDPLRAVFSFLAFLPSSLGIF